MFQFTPQDLRRYPTSHELILWNYLRARRMLGLKFRRQYPIGGYILDFVCLKKKIIIELDGKIHDTQKLYDDRRDFWLSCRGFQVMRIKNEELEVNRELTLMKLRNFLMKFI